MYVITAVVVSHCAGDAEITAGKIKNYIVSMIYISYVINIMYKSVQKLAVKLLLLCQINDLPKHRRC